MLTEVYSCIPMFTLVHLCLPLFIRVYLCLIVLDNLFSHVHPCFTVYSNFPMFALFSRVCLATFTHL